MNDGFDYLIDYLMSYMEYIPESWLVVEEENHKPIDSAIQKCRSYSDDEELEIIVVGKMAIDSSYRDFNLSCSSKVKNSSNHYIRHLIGSNNSIVSWLQANSDQSWIIFLSAIN